MEAKQSEKQVFSMKEEKSAAFRKSYQKPGSAILYYYIKHIVRIQLLSVHIFGLIGIVKIFQGQVMLGTIIFAEILAEFTMLGIGIGAHRLWSHRSFKARLPLRLILAVGFSFCGQVTLWHWAANHRIHHKFADTDLDPHNSRRGVFYSHMGWILTYDHDTFLRSVKRVDISDLMKDPVIRFYERHQVLIQFSLWLLPTFVPWVFWRENLFNAFCVATCLRLVCVAHRTFLINSLAHLYGYKPYDSSIRPVENKLVGILALGEGSHNYHHVFPWDYKNSEFGLYRWNVSTAVIDLFAWIGWAYDLKTVDKDTIAKRKSRTGTQ